MTDTPPAPPPSRRRLRAVRVVTGVLLGLAVGVVVLAVVAAERPVAQNDQPIVPPKLGNGAPAPDFSIPRLGGGPPVALSAYRGRPVVINFFASDCTDCMQELAAFAAASHKLAGRISFLAVDSNDPAPAAARHDLQEAGIGYPAGADPDARVAQRYLVVGLPETVFVNGDGRVVDVETGAQTVSEIERWSAVAEAS
jgi:cytochrome c biogenesis protein CcmG/thiol:disulfide interchange protein DsbE